jgi:ribonucleoside-triphosphate reductase
MGKCQESVEVIQRVVGFMRPVQCWNKGKQEEFKDRKQYELEGNKSA